ncbi:MAG: phage distal tail protein [Blautia hansenii]
MYHELTPINDTISFTIKGAPKPCYRTTGGYYNQKSETGKKVIIDREACTVAQGVTNKFADADMWEFPSLLPGNNTLTFSSALCEVTIKYKPRYF